MIRTFCLNFAFKKSKLLANGTAPLYLRLTIDGKRLEVTTRRYISPALWDNKAQKMKGTHEEARVFNRYLKTLEHQVYEAHRELIESKLSVTVTSLKAKLFGQDEAEETNFLVPVFQEHNRRVEALLGKEYAAGTLERYRTSLKHTVEFIKWQYKANDMEISQIDHAFVSSYEYYLRSQKNCCNNTTVKYLKNFKKIIRICISNGWLVKDPFAAHRFKLTEVIAAYLTKQELELIAQKQFASERINQVRDIFLFSCYTGLAYADVKKLSCSEITTGIDGLQWIMTSRQKTDTASRIPLLNQAKAIVDRYADHPPCVNSGKLLPVLSNQKMNAYLKEIADICGISKPFTYHTARHTFTPDHIR